MVTDGEYSDSLLEEYARFDLVLIDEFGFDHLECAAQPQSSSFYYRLLDARIGRRSTALAISMDFGAWADYVGDPLLTTVVLDRLVDGAVILKLAGRSYRAHCARPHPAGHPSRPKLPDGSLR
ncbi:MAG TPA: ATP-binding protein [Isosphaeraceae bacterium]|nr:ATP-binding protein [Isosphaeraceae bacterium]